MRTVDVRHCPCGQFFVGDHNCPACGALYLQTQLVVRVKKSSLARMIAESIRAHHGDPDVIKFYEERYTCE